jgi:hypothetical protein
MTFQKGHPDYRTPEGLRKMADALRNRWRNEWASRKPQYPEGHKKCSMCKEVKPYSEFTRVSKGDGYFSYCKPCNRRYTQPTRRAMKLRHRYGMTEADYANLLISQSGKCAVCWEPFDERYKGTSASLDHDHETDKLRELVHNNCNCVLGYADDRVDILEKAIEYLKKHSR